MRTSWAAGGAASAARAAKGAERPLPAAAEAFFELFSIYCARSRTDARRGKTRTFWARAISAGSKLAHSNLTTRTEISSAERAKWLVCESAVKEWFGMLLQDISSVTKVFMLLNTVVC